jgi:hypothetical protein
VKVVFGNETVSRSLVFKWYRHLKSCEELWKHDGCSGCPFTSLVKEVSAVTVLVTVTIHQIVLQMLGENLGMQPVSWNSFYNFTQLNKKKWLNICTATS